MHSGLRATVRILPLNPREVVPFQGSVRGDMTAL